MSIVEKKNPLTDELKPSPCGKPGHLAVHWDDSHSPRLDHPDSPTERLLCCTLCQREAAVAEARLEEAEIWRRMPMENDVEGAKRLELLREELRAAKGGK